jgi:hypothetical protein
MVAMRHKLASLVLAGGMTLLAGRAHAQTVYNPDGSRSMLGPDAAGPSVVTPAPSTLAPSSDSVGLVPADPLPAPQEERYDIDCDPDIDVCVDPNAQATFDDGYDPNAYQQFEGSLAPYGTWSEDPTYGHVWTPSPAYVGGDFMPYYTGGEWVPTADYGYAWSSEYDWGWAPFHYGRWLFLASCGGWSWIPGTVWGPAWVDWRYGGGYAGWAPLPPHGVIIPAPLAAHGNRSPWRFIVASEIGRRHPTIVPSKVAPSVFARTAPMRNLRTMSLGGVTTHITLGPPVSTVSHDLGHSIPTLNLKSTAPSTLPRQQIIPHAGVGLGQRTYIQSAGIGMHVPNGAARTAGGYSAPVYHSPTTTAPPTYQYGNTTGMPPAYHYNTPPQQAYHQPPTYASPQYHAPVYSSPQYHAPVYSSPPQYHAPTYSSPPQYHAPTYSSPPQYHAPTYSAPQYHAPTYSAPQYHAPTVSAPSTSRPSSPAPVTRSAPSFGGSTHRH